MHRLFVLILLLLSGFSVAAQNTSWKFKVTQSELKEQVLIYEIYQAGKHSKTRLIEGPDSTVVLIDSVKRQLLVMSETQADAEIYRMGFEDLTADEVGAKLLPDGIDYKLLAEKKTIHGLPCQRVELLSEGVLKGHGWVALGKKLIPLNANFIRPLTTGQLVEFDLETDGLWTSCSLLEYKTGVVYPANFFSPDLKKLKGSIIKD